MLSLGLFTFYRNSSSPICTKFSILFFILHFILLKKLPKCCNSNYMAFLFNFLYAVSSFICSWFLSKICSRHVFASLHFRVICDSFSSSSRKRHFAPFIPCLWTFSFQIPSVYHDVAFTSFNLQQDIYIYRHIQHICFISQNALKTCFSYSVNLTLYIVVPIYNLFDMLALHANTAHFESYISATFCTLTFSTTCPSCPFSDFLFASSNEVSTILLVTSVKC